MRAVSLRTLLIRGFRVADLVSFVDSLFFFCQFSPCSSVFLTEVSKILVPPKYKFEFVEFVVVVVVFDLIFNYG